MRSSGTTLRLRAQTGSRAFLVRTRASGLGQPRHRSRQSDLRALFGLRVWRQHACTEDRAARGMSRLGISLPVYEWGAARQHIQSRTVAALSARREEVEHLSRPLSSPLPAGGALLVGRKCSSDRKPHRRRSAVVHEAQHGTPSRGWRQSCHLTWIVRRPGRDGLGKARSGQCRDRRLGSSAKRPKTQVLASSESIRRAHTAVMRARWRVMLDGATEEALLAVDLYNQPRQPRRLEGFFVHMHLAWLYLLHAEFRRDGIDFRYRLPSRRFERVDGEPKTWDLQKSVSKKWPDGGPAGANLELTIALRNKIEHRYHEAVGVATAGYAPGSTALTSKMN